MSEFGKNLTGKIVAFLILSCIMLALGVFSSSARSSVLSQSQIDILSDEVEQAIADKPALADQRDYIFFSSKFVLEHSSNKGLWGAIGRELGRAVIGATVGEVAREVHYRIKEREKKEKKEREKPAERPAPQTHDRRDPPPAPCPSPS